ncbi:hypothetical protein [Pseudotabrizicola algicola]|uniref:Uncharacterized protein n=1 Tax=Pseudotabrizicola algicola TaxID=2709381 RepID=A0A6B3RNL3_9RHOB|nr:hypothetical protein [Pseudotabrizicola algicola]NEX44642.1 hypothetical protein [Pseudotabrizicola algicola]
MDYCTKWQLLGFALGYAPILIGFVIAIVVGRLPRRLWLGLIAGLPAGLAFWVVTYPFVLVLWNGIRPAVCNGM